MLLSICISVGSRHCIELMFHLLRLGTEFSDDVGIPLTDRTRAAAVCNAKAQLALDGCLRSNSSPRGSSP